MLLLGCPPALSSGITLELGIMVQVYTSPLMMNHTLPHASVNAVSFQFLKNFLLQRPLPSKAWDSQEPGWA